MNAAGTFFHTWLEQLGRMASINENIEQLYTKQSPDDAYDVEQGNQEELEAEIRRLQSERKKIKDAADHNKKALIQMLEQAENQELIISPRQDTGGLTPHAYRVYLEKGDLKYLTLS
ncbi:hypothetical protein ACFSPU_04370 [Haoranjiania flava]|uniref:Uncharacterized protein n=1 Tax=Haoranjiania flava TaxID=1856322 RepID=A0AAE3IS59_9BACT|nr:hypothetical protein [Haoranjiania flava]MCU7694802.1 hypothetical protein [Haoranjiania flava]